MAYSARAQAGMYYRRKNNRSRVMVSKLTPWRAGLVVVKAGEYVQSFGQAFVSLNSGTTGATAPTGNSKVSDGVVTWQFVDTQAVLTPPVTP